ncbi:carbohydrate binding domain protein [Aspergillus japonicus CBS 114.51]|uniref:Carbohydrate binding domain protein n=2 Tax=Aspergillus TaxID=5052 RepID=A0A2V5HFW7_ASPV1|nr:carbohydrate binding domain protein [Aspergillus japonicus CBS 114.51]PYI14880.1 carbohydrate binding domain protein [Aspergillus violaceofuscus CBS 115571]RAH84748.1 carbohydrate binding domain protein [Aspergillus japonicus CBS 114.51]
MSCNLLTNPSFETGTLSPWFTTVPNVNIATVTNATAAYDGEYYLDLKTDYGNRGHSIAQTLTGLQRGTVYDFSAQIQIPGPSGVEYCFVDAYVGANATTGAIVSQQLLPTGEWTTVRGSYQRTGRRAEDVLTLTGSCTSPGSSYVWDVLVDEVVFGAAEGCV